MAILNILDISKCKKGDTLTFRYNNLGTPSNPLLDIYDLDDNVISNNLEPDYEDDDYYYWFYVASSLTENKHYKFIIDDVTPYASDEYLIYISSELTFENTLIRAKGLTGFNYRFYNMIYINGNLTSFKIRTYETKTKLDTADTGGTDDYIASYTVEINYDSDYNISKIESTLD